MGMTACSYDQFLMGRWVPFVVEAKPLILNKRPFKCPVCEGSGQLLVIQDGSASTPPTKACHACEGKGLVWG
jgi:hypothetical protein